MKLLIFLLVVPMWCQTGQPVRVSDNPSDQAVQRVYVASGGNIVAICSALSSDGSRTGRQVAISAVSKANPAVVTSVGHGFDTGSRPQVTISGATGTGWTAINGTFAATVIDADTFSLYTLAGVAVDSSGFGTLGGTVIFTTPAPRTVIAEWAVQKIVYSGTTPTWSGWVNGVTAYTQKCSNATSTTIVQQ